MIKFIFQYVSKAVPGPVSEKLNLDTNLDGCDCQTSTEDTHICLKNNCSCLKNYGCSFNTRGFIVGIDPYSSTMKPIYECNRFCKCPSDCINRVVQKGITLDLQIFRTKSKGSGLRTMDGISKGQFVCEYAGQIISHSVAKFRAESQQPSDNNYILALREHLDNGKTLCTYVDPRTIGNAGRFINHSCEPNLFMVPVRIDTNIPRLALFALRDIVEGEELCYDYSGQVQKTQSSSKATSREEFTDEDVETIKLDNMIRSDNKKMGKAKCKICTCGSKQCRGYLPLDEALYESN